MTLNSLFSHLHPTKCWDDRRAPPYVVYAGAGGWIEGLDHSRCILCQPRYLPSLCPGSVSVSSFRGMSGFSRSVSFWQVDLASFLDPKERTKDWSFSLPKISILKEASSVCLDHGHCWRCLHLNSPYKATRPHHHLYPPHVPSFHPHTSASQHS